ncbi:MAG: hypothetical protein QME88_02355 [Actinomycetota bacterium]|nr:hypothetical protein [Actinomycetota bacterium]
MLLVGWKSGHRAPDPYDLDLLVRYAAGAGVFIESYLLSSYLLVQLEELREATGDSRNKSGRKRTSSRSPPTNFAPP